MSLKMRQVLCAAAMAAFCYTLPAQAGLGEGLEALVRDRATLGAPAATVVHAASYDRHELLAANGVRVREFADHSGHVFAVTFTGPALPDLKTVLGTRFAEYAAVAHASPTTHKVYRHHSATLDAVVMKLPRGFAGSAVEPANVPAGVDPRDLR